MKRMLAAVVVTAGLLIASAPGAMAAPPPIVFCMPDLDGHCRYCEIRFAPISMRCLS